METILRVKNISFAYEKKEILRDISLSVAQDDSLIILGASGEPN